MATRTVGDLARALDVTTQTVRSWSDLFQDFLSPSATPPRGEVRAYTEEDAAVLALVGKLRAQAKNFDEIRAMLEEGQRATLPSGEGEAADEMYPPVPILAAQLARREGELDAIKEERDRLLKELETARAAWLDAEKKAAAAQAEARLLRELRELEYKRRSLDGDS